MVVLKCDERRTKKNASALKKCLGISTHLWFEDPKELQKITVKPLILGRSFMILKVGKLFWTCWWIQSKPSLVSPRIAWQTKRIWANYPFEKERMSPFERNISKGKQVFQPSFFRGQARFRGTTHCYRVYASPNPSIKSLTTSPVIWNFRCTSLADHQLRRSEITMCRCLYMSWKSNRHFL